MTPMNVVVTGASGFIGAHVVQGLLLRGDRVHSIPHRWRTAQELDRQLPNQVEGCVHLGWYAAPHDYLTNAEKNRLAYRSSLELASAMRARGCRHLVVAGTCAEYAEQHRPLVETDPLEPATAYAEYKIALQEMLRADAVPLSGMALTWTRIFNVTGPHENQHRFLPTIARAVLARQHLALSACDQVRDFLHVEDVATALITALKAPGSDVLNISSGAGRPLRQTALGVARRLGDPSVLRFGAKLRGAHDRDELVGDSTRLRSLGWSPQKGYDATLDAVANFWRNYGERSG